MRIIYMIHIFNGTGVSFHPEFSSKALIASSNYLVSSSEETLPMEPFFSREESKYSLDDHSESHSGSIDISINAINLIPDGILTSVPMEIYVSTNYYSVDSLDPVYSSKSFVTGKTRSFLR